MDFNGIRVVANPLAVIVEPVRKHRRRRSQSFAYHQRIQKKWRKRFGTKKVPTAYQMNGRIYGFSGPVLVVHPDLMTKIRSASR